MTGAGPLLDADGSPLREERVEDGVGVVVDHGYATVHEQRRRTGRTRATRTVTSDSPADVIARVGSTPTVRAMIEAELAALEDEARGIAREHGHESALEPIAWESVDEAGRTWRHESTVGAQAAPSSRLGHAYRLETCVADTRRHVGRLDVAAGGNAEVLAAADLAILASLRAGQVGREIIFGALELNAAIGSQMRASNTGKATPAERAQAVAEYRALLVGGRSRKAAADAVGPRYGVSYKAVQRWEKQQG